jgi:hypothetical protein
MGWGSFRAGELLPQARFGQGRMLYEQASIIPDQILFMLLSYLAGTGSECQCSPDLSRSFEMK